jgi:hypothetical protein
VISLSYVPPEKKSKSGTSSFGDVVYLVAFYLVEFLFIFVGIPTLVFAVGVIPIAMYVIIAQKSVIWPLYVLGGVIAFVQIAALSYFFQRFILKPRNMNFFQWVRWKFHPAEIAKRRKERQDRSEKIAEWYDGMGRVQASKEQLIEEQSLKYEERFMTEEEKASLESTTTQESTGIVFGKIEEERSKEESA